MKRPSATRFIRKLDTITAEVEALQERASHLDLGDTKDLIADAKQLLISAGREAVRMESRPTIEPRRVGGVT